MPQEGFDVVPQEWAIALFTASVAAVLGLFSAITGIINYRRRQSDNHERALGRLEGSGLKEQGAGRVDGNIMMSIGELKEGVTNLREDIVEIKLLQTRHADDIHAIQANQTENRNLYAFEAKELRGLITTMSGEFEKMRREFRTFKRKPKTTKTPRYSHLTGERLD